MNAKQSIVLSAAAAPLLGLLLAACSSNAPSTDTSSDQALGRVHPGLKSRVHKMPLQPKTSRGLRPLAQKSASTAPGPSGAQLTYYGGKVIPNVTVYTVYWGAGVQFTSALEGFYGSFTSNSVMDLLGEYGTSSQSIGHGSFAGAITDSSPPAGTTIDDAQIQQELDRLITAGQLPPNNGTNLYMVHFPPGITITQGGSSSCSAFCGYHGTYNSTAGGNEVYYGVIPDLGGACAGGCGSNSQQDNTTLVTSHEISEAVTDAEVGLATGSALGAPLAWYDGTNGEIGDICAWKGQDTIDGYVVQLEWSNAQGLCASAPSGSPPPPPVDAGPGDDGGSDSGPPPPPPPGTCAHPICSQGASLDGTCDPCATQICQQDGYCCSTLWDSQCVSEVGSICGQTCN
jgi:hypothetical protein